MRRTLLTLTFAAAAAYPAESSFSYTNKDGAAQVLITNVTYDLAAAQRLVLRKTTQTREVLEEKGMEAATTVEAWKLGTPFTQKPLYTVKASGVDPTVANGALLTISRGLEDVAWWSVYRLGNGKHLFDTYTPLAQVSITHDVQTVRYIGLEVPPDDATNPRLKAANVVAVLVYASEDRVIREALITAADPSRARLLRSYFDATRTIAVSPQSIELTIRENDGRNPPVTVRLAIAKDDLDLAHAQTPAGIQVSVFQR